MNKGLFKNIGFLSLSNAANYILPLITIPYITRVVGPANYGLIEFATTAMLYFSAVVIYGYQVTATRKIAEHPDNLQHISQVFSSVLYARLSLFFISLIGFLICMLVLDEFREESLLMWVAFPVVLGWAIYPQFLFQGLQKLQYIAISNFAVKALAAVLIFTLIFSSEDYYLVLGINSLAQIVVAVALLFHSFKAVPGLKLVPINWQEIKKSLGDGSYVFLSSFFMRISQFSSVLFIGFYLTDLEMGLFASGAKLLFVGYSFLFLPLSGALFPYLTNLLKKSKKDYLNRMKRAFWLMLLVTLISTLILIFFPEFFIKLVFGSEYLSGAPYLQILAPILVFSTFSHFSLQQGLIIFKRDKLYLAVVVASGVLAIILNLTLIKSMGASGAAWAKLGSEAFMALLGAIIFWRVYRKI